MSGDGKVHCKNDRMYGNGCNPGVQQVNLSPFLLYCKHVKNRSEQCSARWCSSYWRLKCVGDHKVLHKHLFYSIKCLGKPDRKNICSYLHIWTFSKGSNPNPNSLRHFFLVGFCQLTRGRGWPQSKHFWGTFLFKFGHFDKNIFAFFFS